MIKRGPGFLAVVYDIALSTPPPPPPHQQARPATHKTTEKERQLADGRVGGRRWGRSQIPRQQKSLWSSENHKALRGRIRAYWGYRSQYWWSTRTCISSMDRGFPRLTITAASSSAVISLQTVRITSENTMKIKKKVWYKNFIIK